MYLVFCTCFEFSKITDDMYDEHVKNFDNATKICNICHEQIVLTSIFYLDEQKEIGVCLDKGLDKKEYFHLDCIFKNIDFSSANDYTKAFNKEHNFFLLKLLNYMNINDNPKWHQLYFKHFHRKSKSDCNKYFKFTEGRIYNNFNMIILRSYLCESYDLSNYRECLIQHAPKAYKRKFASFNNIIQKFKSIQCQPLNGSSSVHESVFKYLKNMSNYDFREILRQYCYMKNLNTLEILVHATIDDMKTSFTDDFIKFMFLFEESFVFKYLQIGKNFDLKQCSIEQCAMYLLYLTNEQFKIFLGECDSRFRTEIFRYFNSNEHFAKLFSYDNKFCDLCIEHYKIEKFCQYINSLTEEKLINCIQKLKLENISRVFMCKYCNLKTICIYLTHFKFDLSKAGVSDYVQTRLTTHAIHCNNGKMYFIDTSFKNLTKTIIPHEIIDSENNKIPLVCFYEYLEIDNFEECAKFLNSQSDEVCIEILNLCSFEEYYKIINVEVNGVRIFKKDTKTRLIEFCKNKITPHYSDVRNSIRFSSFPEDQSIPEHICGDLTKHQYRNFCQKNIRKCSCDNDHMPDKIAESWNDSCKNETHYYYNIESERHEHKSFYKVIAVETLCELSRIEHLTVLHQKITVHEMASIFIFLHSISQTSILMPVDYQSLAL